jgi:hypothetical protein
MKRSFNTWKSTQSSAGPRGPKNEFEKVDAVQPDAITLELVAQEGVQFGVVHGSASASGGRMIDNIVTNSILPLFPAASSAPRPPRSR